MGSLNLIGSQIDVAGVVSKLMEIERQPVYQLENRIASMKKKVTAYQTLNTSLSALSNNVNKLLYGTTYAPLVSPSSFKERLDKSIFTSRTATSSNENALTAMASGTVTNGSYSIKINQLAQVQTSVSGGYSITHEFGPLNGYITLGGASVAINLAAAKNAEYASNAITGPIGSEGKITISHAGGSFTIDVADTDDLSALAGKINGDPAFGAANITAQVVGDKLEIKSIAAGTANAVSITVEDDKDNPGLSEALGLSMTQEATNTTLRELQEAINKAGAGVTASIMYDGTDYRLMLTSDKTGAANSFTIGGSLAGVINIHPADQHAQDAEMYVNGIRVTSSSNTVKDAIEGVIINLKNVTKTDEVVKLDVAVDNEAIVSSVNDIISSYNAVVNYINYQFTYNTSTESSGVLAGDTTLRSIQSRLQSIISTGGVPLGEAGAYRSIGQLGISYNKDGTLSLDESKLKEALANDPDAVAAFFLGYESIGSSGRIGGVLTNLGEALKGLTDPLRGPIQNALQGINSNISSLQQSIDAYERRLESREDILYAQFNAADQALRMMQVTMASVSSSLATLLNNNNNKA